MSLKKTRKRKIHDECPKARITRGIVLESLSISSQYSNASFASIFKNQFTDRRPFSYYHFLNFVDNSNGSVENIEAALQEFPSWSRKENDLYSLWQTKDFKSFKPSDHPILYNFRQFLISVVRPFLSQLTGVRLIEQVDVNGSLYAQYDNLLPHSDLIDTRHFAFVYYLTPFTWKNEDGGFLQLFDSNEEDEPIKVHCELAPRRNSLLIFEVSHRSWHRVAEVLGSDPRLSINGWFHSSRRLEAVQKPNSDILQRITPSVEGKPSFLSDKYQNSKERKQIQEMLKEIAEVALPDFLKDDFLSKLVKNLESQKFVELWKPNKRKLYRATIPRGKELKEFTAYLKSTHARDFFASITDLNLQDCQCSLTVSKVVHGCYVVLGDEDAAQSAKDGHCLDVNFYISSDWDEEAGGELVYMAEGEEDELCRVAPSQNTLAVTVREPGTMSFLKYVDGRAESRVAYLFSLVYYDVSCDTDDECEDH